MGYLFHKQKRLVCSLPSSRLTRLTMYGISKPSLFQPVITSASSIRSRNVLSSSFSLFINIVSGNFSQIACAVSASSPLGATAKQIVRFNQLRCTATAVTGLNGSLGGAKPKSLLKSTSISKNAMLRSGTSAFK